MIRNKYYTAFFWISLIISLILPLNANITASASSISSDPTGFSYKIDFPENQIDPSIGYYKLKMVPGAKQELSIPLSNPGKEKIIVSVGLNRANTNKNGVIEYGTSDIKKDASLVYDFKTIVTGPDKIELQSGETKTLVLTINMPESSYDGIIAGGIQLMKEEDSSTDGKSKGAQVINQYAYVIGLLLQETDQSVAPNLKLNKVYAGQSNAQNTIYVDYSNVTATYLDEMTTEVQITAKDSKTVLYERKQSGMRMAPNSFIPFPVSMNGERMAAGDYKAKVLVTSGEKKWEWEENFTITTKEADKFNERDIGLVQEKGLNWTYIIGGVIGCLLLFGLIFVVVRSVRKKKEEQRKKRKKKNRRIREIKKD